MRPRLILFPFAIVYEINYLRRKPKTFVKSAAIAWAIIAAASIPLAFSWKTFILFCFAQYLALGVYYLLKFRKNRGAWKAFGLQDPFRHPPRSPGRRTRDR